MIKTGNKNFWIAQIIGWSIMAGSNLLIQFAAGFPMGKILYNTLTPMLVGFILTSVYRYIVRKLDWRNWSLNKTLSFLIGSTFILTSVFMLVVFIVIRFVFEMHSLSIAGFLSNMFTFTLIILTWNLIYFSIHYFNNWTEAELEKWKLAAEMKDAQLGSLKSQIQPHFVFNTINNIRSLILEDKEKAREMLINFSDMFRYALKNTAHSKVKLEEELEIVQQYLELLSIQYEDKLQYNIQVEEGLSEIQLPPMMLQLLVENAIKHGISQCKEGGSISMDIEGDKDGVQITVRNTGSLNSSSSLEDHLGVGLENIRKRLVLIYSGKATMDIKDIDHYVVATIKIPVL